MSVPFAWQRKVLNSISAFSLYRPAAQVFLVRFYRYPGPRFSEATWELIRIL